MQHCPVCRGPIFIGLSGITRCLNKHIISIPGEFSIAIELSSMPLAGWHSTIIVEPIGTERTPVDRIFQEAFGEGELEL